MLNRYLSGAVVLSMLAANSAMAAVTVYGKASVSLQAVKETTMDGSFVAQDNVELLSNKSRFGIKGEEAMNDPLKVIYQMEWEVAIDNGDTGSGQALKQRNTFIGLAGDWGALMAGIHDTPTKMISKPVDLFNELKYGDVDNALVGEVRHKNMVIYRSPMFSGFNIDLMVAPGEDKGSDSLAGAEDSKLRNDAANALSSSVSYQQGGFKAALAIDSKVEQKLAVGSIDVAGAAPLDDIGSRIAYEGETDLQRLVLSWDAAQYGVAGLLQQARQSGGDFNAVAISIDTGTAAVVKTDFGKAEAEQFSSVALAAYVKHGEWKFKALAIETAFSEADTDLQQWVIGADYRLNKNTLVYTYGSEVTAENQGFELGSNTTFGTGIEYVF